MSEDSSVAEFVASTVTKQEGILLTDEEIKEAIASHFGERDWTGMVGDRAVAKAQLKKVVEWLERYHIKSLEGNPEDVPAVYSDGGYRIPTKDVQTLLKEVGDNHGSS